MRPKTQLTSRPLWAFLPPAFTFFFCAVTIYALVGELLPAIREKRRAEAALDAQLQAYDAVVADCDHRAKELESLFRDPQERERVLDEKGVLVRPSPPSAER